MSACFLSTDQTDMYNLSLSVFTTVACTGMKELDRAPSDAGCCLLKD